MGEIDVGPGAVDRPSLAGPGYTVYDKQNPANDDGILDTFEAWANTTVGGCRIGTASFSGNTSTPTDSELIGTITAGSKQVFSGLEFEVNSGDYLGVYWSSGQFEISTFGGVGYWTDILTPGDYLDTSHLFTYYTTYVISIYATGSTISPSRRGTQVIMAGM